MALVNWVRHRVDQLGITPMPEPPEVRQELVDLGQALAFDRELSGSRDVSCMTCHHPGLGSDDDRVLSIGVNGFGLGTERVHPEDIAIPRNATPLFNLHAMNVMFWDGRVSFHGSDVETPADEELTPEMLEVFEFGAVSAQAMFPVTSRAEMRGRIGTNDLSMVRDDDFTGQWTMLMERLGQIPEYVEMFEAAYPGTAFEDMTFAHAANAIAGFEIAAFAATESPWDEFLRGDDDALTKEQLEGAKEFLGTAGCVNCHSGAALTDLDFHNTALAQFGPGKNNGATNTDDWGRYNVFHEPDQFYAFRTAPLRNIALTGPYGHVGQYDSLAAFVEHYIDPEASLLAYDPVAEGVDPSLAATLLANYDAIFRHLSPELAQGNVKQHRVDEIVAFLEALTDPTSLEDADDIVPESVPSGLPVAEVVQVIPDNYAGTITDTWSLPASTFYEYQLQRPEMCNDDGTASVTFDRNANTLAIDAHIVGQPYRPSVCFEFNPTTPYNAYPDCVENGVWQIWFIPRIFNLHVPFWYDALTGDLIASDWELESPPPNAFPVTLPATQMIGTPAFESDPETLIADVHFEYEYDRIIDDIGSAGALVAVLPFNIFNPTELNVYYSQGGLDEQYAMNWTDMIVQNAEGRNGFALATSYGPNPKPAYLAARDNTMLGFAVQWPQPRERFTIPVEQPCGTDFQWDGANLNPLSP